MRFLMFYHTLLSDWNHGNAHFLRGIASELLARGHEVQVLEPRNSWSANSLLREQGMAPFRKFHGAYPELKAIRYDPVSCSLEQVLQGADVVIVHEWNDPALVRRIGEHRSRAGGFRLYFHDTHHRMVTDPQSMAKYDLSNYDGVLAYGNVLKELYETAGRVQRAWTWHEAADTRVFRPLGGEKTKGDVVWIGNWGDEERTSELREFFMEPCRSLALNARVYGVRYPQTARRALEASGIHYAGWLPNFEVPRVFSQFHLTVHIPRRPYVNALPGIPTIRPFEALACGIPLVSSPWQDAEELFSPGSDFLVARSGQEMKRHLRTLLADHELRSGLAAHGLRTILARHTCAHRVDELLAIDAGVRGTKPRRKNFPLNV